jgi:hypothetical protein
MNNTDKHLEFKISEEGNNSINYLAFSIHRNAYNKDLGIYRKPTHTDITIQFSSNHPHEHKMEAFNYYINRILMLPITKQAKQQEWKIVLATAKKQWISIANHSQSAEKTENQTTKKKLLKYDNTTNQEMDNIHILQPTNTKN